MDGINITYSDTNVGNALLVVSQSLVLLNSICKVSIYSDVYDSLEHKQHSLLASWKFDIDFTDNPKSADTQMGITLEIDHINKRANIICHRWYGTGMENTHPISIKSVASKREFMIKIRTTCYESKEQRRQLEISIWMKRI